MPALIAAGYSTLQRNKVIALFVVIGFLPFLVQLKLITTSNYSFPYKVERLNVTLKVNRDSIVNSWGSKTPFIIVDTHDCFDSTICHMAIGKKVILNDYKGREFYVGDEILTEVRLKPPLGFHNPGGFDYEHWLYSKGIWAVGYLRGEHKLIAQSFDVGWYSRLGRILSSSDVGDEELARGLGLVKALVLADKSSVSEEDKQILMNSGLIHLFVISGLHVGLLFGCLLLVIRSTLAVLIGRFSSYISSRAILFSNMLPLCLVWWYVIQIDYPIAALRAAIFISLWQLSRFFSSEMSIWHVISITCWLVLAMFPEQIFSVGFWMSFVAVSCLALPIWGRLKSDVEKGNRGKVKLGFMHRGLAYLSLALKFQISVTLGLMPFVLWLQSNASFIGVFWNLVLIPLFSVFVVPFLLLSVAVAEFSSVAAFELFSVLAQSLVWLIDVVETSLLAIERVDWLGDVSLIYPPLLIGYPLLLILLPVNKLFKVFGITSVVFILLVTSSAKSELKLWFLDVGQAQSVVFVKNNRAVVYDAGFRSGRFNAADAVIIPFLRSRRVHSVDHLVISHKDSDHSGGLSALMASEYEPSQLHLNYEQRNSGAFESVGCARGDKWEWQGVGFEVLWPPKQTFLDGDVLSNNDRSCVVRAVFGNNEVLLVGDITSNVESELVRLGDFDGRGGVGTVLSMPHHGSKTSSSPEFIDSVDPLWVVASSGPLSRYGHPAKEVVNRYLLRDIKVLDTARHGAVKFKYNKSELEGNPVSWRAVNHFHWHTDRFEEF